MFNNSVWDLKLSNGTVYLNMYISNEGLIEGKVVGGQTGIAPLAKEIEESNIIAIRKSVRFFGISLGRWIKARKV